MQFGWSADKKTSFAVMDASVEGGGSLVGTADIYSNWSTANPGGRGGEITEYVEYTPRHRVNTWPTASAEIA